MADLVNEAISWLQNGEPITGGSGGDSVGVLNRPLVQLLANDNGLQDRIDIFADDDGYIKKIISSIKVTETDAATTARVQIDATGLKQYDGTNICVDLDESGNATIGYGANDKITLVAGVLTVKANELDITGVGNSGISLENATGDALSIAGAGANAIEVEAATEYGLKLGNNTSGYGPLHIVNAGVTGASNLHTTYGSAEVDTLAIDDQHDLFIKTGASTWQKVGATASPVAVVDTATITGTATTDNSVVIDANGLTMRKAAGAVRFDINEDGSFTLGNSAGAKIDFTSGDVLSVVSATLTTCTIDADNNTISNLEHGAEVDNPVSGVHGVAGNVVGTSDNQTLTTKTIDADSNTISNLEHGNEVDNPSSGVHGVVGDVVGTSDNQTLTTKTIDADNNTISNLAHGSEVDNPSSGVHGVVGNVVGTSDNQTLTTKTIDADNNTISNLEHGNEVDNPTTAHGTSSAIVGIDDTQTLTQKTLTSPKINENVVLASTSTDIDNAVSNSVSNPIAGGSSGHQICKTNVWVTQPTNTLEGYIDVSIGASYKYNDLFSGVFSLTNLQDNDTWVADGSNGSAKVDGADLYIQCIGAATVEEVISIREIGTYFPFPGDACYYPTWCTTYSSRGVIRISLLNQNAALNWCTGIGNYLAGPGTWKANLMITYIATPV